MKRAVLFFVKYPEPGRVKTRMAAAVGSLRAAEIYRVMVQETCRRLPRAGMDLIVCFDPPERREAVIEWLSPDCGDLHPAFLAQAGGDLGNRIKEAFEQAFRDGYDQVAVIGSDCPEISPLIFEETWGALREHDVALGTTSDGGYYLLALSAAQPELFHEIAWSTDAVAGQTLDRIREGNLRVYRLPELDDVDTESDWLRLQPRLKR